MSRKIRYSIDGVKIDGATGCRVDISTEKDGVIVTVKPYKKKTAYWTRLSSIVPSVVEQHKERESRV